MRRRITAVALLSLSSTVAIAQDRFANVQIKTTHVAGNVYLLEGQGGNIGVSAGEDGLLMIDDQFLPLAAKIRAALDKLAQNNGQLQFVLNTHYHGDHTGGNPAFGKDATIIAHENVRKRLISPQELFGRTTDPLPREGWPVITFEHSLSIHFNAEEIQVIHYPHGHTDGDSVIFFAESKVVHMGDHFFNGMFPFVDLDHGGDVQDMARNVADVIERTPPDAKIIPGHGPVGTVADLKTYQRMLTETTAHVRKQIDAGKSRAEIIAAGVPGEWKSWGNGFIKTEHWVETIHNSLTRETGETG